MCDQPETDAIATLNKPDDLHDGEKLQRLLFVFSSMSPVFLLWAIRGSDLIQDKYLIVCCISLFLILNFYPILQIMRARAKFITREITVAEYGDRRQDVISYLFAMLLPFYSADLDSYRALFSTLAALFLVVLLFWSLDLQYLNLLGALLRFHCYEVTTGQGNPGEDSLSFMVITRRRRLARGSKISGYVVSSHVLYEVIE